MAIHVIPEGEEDKHQESENCICEPIFKLDEGSGEMIWIHQILDWDKLVNEMITL